LVSGWNLQELPIENIHGHSVKFLYIIIERVFIGLVPTGLDNLDLVAFDLANGNKWYQLIGIIDDENVESIRGVYSTSSDSEVSGAFAVKGHQSASEFLMLDDQTHQIVRYKVSAGLVRDSTGTGNFFMAKINRICF
jgi:hypothetical protein